MAEPGGGLAGWALSPGEIIIRGHFCKIGGNTRLKEKGKTEREEGKEWGNRGSIGPAQGWYLSMKQ